MEFSINAHAQSDHKLKYVSYPNILYESCWNWAIKININKIHYLGSNSCHVIDCHILLWNAYAHVLPGSYFWLQTVLATADDFRISNGSLSWTGGCKWQNLDIRCQSWLKIMVCRKENSVFLANVMFLIFVFTSFNIVQEPLSSPSTSQ